MFALFHSSEARFRPGRNPMVCSSGFSAMAFGDETLTEVTMSIVYNYTLKHDRNGRIVEKVETVNGKAMKWTGNPPGN